MPELDALVFESLLKGFETVLNLEVSFAFRDWQEPENSSVTTLPFADLELWSERIGNRDKQVVTL